MPTRNVLSRRFTVVCLLVVSGVIAGRDPACAQDATYWTLQHGNQARLLGGTVVGGSEDVSATYYNPGRLALLDSPELVLAGNVFEYTSISIDGALDGNRFKSTRLGSVPSLFAGQIRGLSRGKSQWAYSFLSRHNSQFRIDERRDITGAVGYPVDLAVAGYSLDETMSEYWAGLTWAYPLSEHVGLGVTGYVAIRSQRSRALIMAQVARDEPGGSLAGIAVQRSDFDYNHWGLLAKIGLGADLGAWRLGLAVTTPNLKVYGNGSIGLDESLVSQDLDGDGDAPAQVLSGFEKDIAVDYNAAPSLSLGVSRRWTQTTVHLTAEWFAGVSGYEVLDGAPVASSDGAVVRDPDLLDARQAVLNAGVGFEHRFRAGLTGYASFRTDFTSIKSQRESGIAVGIWDIYHVTGGATFDALSSTFTLGLMYAFGSTAAEPAVALVPDTGGTTTAESDRLLKYGFRRITGLLGFAFGF